MRAIFDNLIVQEVNIQPTKTNSGILLPNVQGKLVKYGRVVTVGEGIIGPGGDITPLPINPGALVCYDVNFSTQFSHQGVIYYGLKAHCIIAVLGDYCEVETLEDVETLNCGRAEDVS